MEDKCPKCGTPLITKTIKKELGLGSIDYPVALVCSNCQWNRDLTGAADLVAKPVMKEGEIKKELEKPALTRKPLPKPEPTSSGINKIITVALAVLVIVGIVWAFYQPSQEQPIKVPRPAPTPEITITPVITATPAPEVTPTGNKIRIKLDGQRGFNPKMQTIKAGDEIVWRNDGVITVTLVSNERLFDNQLLAYDKEYRYIFKKLGTYSFGLKDKNLSGTIVVEP